MSETFRCDDKEMLVAYLYGEIDSIGRREVDRHLRTCAGCADEVAGLQAVRHDLESWLPPEADLGFSVVQKPGAIVRSSRWSMAAVPSWAQLAAAVLVLAAGAAIANVRVQYNDAGLSVSTGWMTPASAPVSVAAPVTASAARMPAEEWRPALIALEQQLRNEMTQIKRASASVEARSGQGATDEAAIIRKVETLIADSEKRQRQDLALRFVQLTQDFDARRRADLMRVNQNIGRLEGQTISSLNMLRRVSTQPNP